MKLSGIPWDRKSALVRLADWMPHAREYASTRNFDRHGHDHVSLLSPAIQRRLITEEEVVAAVLQEYPLRAVEKFVQEIHWRTYWKGWLEGRPQVWADYRAALSRIDREACEGYGAATGGNTGIECFDHWVNELIETGYLHNHARMWFASIWIFTLRLPWELGAEFFESHLLDADAASNTLSWRWVAGLQTAGKIYVATAANIQRYTEGRFFPQGQLNEKPESPRGPANHPAPVYEEFPRLQDLQLGDRPGLWVHPEDLSVEMIQPGRRWDYIAVTPNVPAPQSLAHSELNEEASSDALERISRGYGSILPETSADAILRWALGNQLQEIVAAKPFVGPWLELADELERIALKRGIRVRWFRREWDTQLFPQARRGFFPFWQSCLGRLQNSDAG